MVLGLRSNTRKGPSVQLDYIIHIQEIKPWPPSQSLRNLRGVLVQWEHGDKNSGLTNQVVPLLDAGGDVGEGRIEFNESFKLHFSLSREMSAKGGDGDTFQKNCIEFNVYEPRRDKTVKGQLLATAFLDLADYGIVNESLSIGVPINCKRTYRNTVQPLLFLKIQPVEKSRSSSSSKDSLMREASMDRNNVECVSTLMKEEYAEEAEVTSYTTDDDVSSHSSQAITSSAAESNGSLSPQRKEDMAVPDNGSAGDANNDHANDDFVDKLDEKQMTEANVTGNSSRSSSTDLSSDLAWISKKIISRSLQPLAAEGKEKEQISNIEDEEYESGVGIILENIMDGGRDEVQPPNSDDGIATSPIPQENIVDLDSMTNNNTLDSALDHCHDNVDALFSQNGDMLEGKRTNSTQNGVSENEARENNVDYPNKRIEDEKEQQIDDRPLADLYQVDIQKQVTAFHNGQVSVSGETIAFVSDLSTSDKLKQVKSVRSSIDSNRRNGSVRSSEHKDTRLHMMETKNLLSDSVVQHLENRIKNLEGELREAAAIEISLYSVVAEHGSSMTKVHAPARRLSRLYFHARRQNPNSRRGSAAKSIVSGLVLAAKACGNDVPRLTFWLSNSIVLRVIMIKSLGVNQLPISIRPVTETVDRNGKMKSSLLKWESFLTRGMRSATEESFGDWENPLAFVAALEKVEAWIFSRIIESIWWQTFTPHMQSCAAKSINKSMESNFSKLHQATSSSIEKQGNFSLELWKKAFRDACERICPVRAGGHDCGCLPILSRLIMEPLIARLDVAMFNAILRESADEIPTDPMADPISDADVLPIPAGKASFGAGAQLKNAIGHWSRWLTDLFGIDDDESPENESGSETFDDDEQRSPNTTSKSFHLLNALSDLMMLPKDMLLSRTIRKEVCPTFGPPMIRRILNCFIPDEFCSDPIPGVVLEALNSEDSLDTEEDSIMAFPCAAAPVVYEPPSASSVAGFSDESGGHPLLTRNGSSLLKKSQTSDDELDELDSPLKSIHLDFSQSSPSSVKPNWISNKNGGLNAVRYQLLRGVWMNSE